MNDGGNSKNCGVGSGENPIEIIHQGSEEGNLYNNRRYRTYDKDNGCKKKSLIAILFLCTRIHNESSAGIWQDEILTNIK